jgi:hypothetical protein
VQQCCKHDAVDSAAMRRFLCYYCDMTKDEFVSVRIKKSVRSKARKLAAKLSSERKKHVKPHEALDYKFKN